MHEDTIRKVTHADPEFPTAFNDVHSKFWPEHLWVRGTGNLADLTRKSIAIVGARACTMYGEQVALDMAQSLTHLDYTIVNGGAYGIDVAALRGAMHTPSVIVLGCGVDRVYPAAHASLFDSVLAAGGLIVSEYDPGTAPNRERFLRRNEITAALTRATVVVEAGVRSGSMQTARVAKEMGRPVMAVPGPVTSITSAGPHRLIRHDGALLVENYADVVAALV